MEGAPGLAKTRAIKVLGDGVAGDFHRIEFTPDLLPADLAGTEIADLRTAVSRSAGPLFLQSDSRRQDEPGAAKEFQSAAGGDGELRSRARLHASSSAQAGCSNGGPESCEQGGLVLPEAQLDRFLVHPESATDAMESVRFSIWPRTRRSRTHLRCLICWSEGSVRCARSGTGSHAWRSARGVSAHQIVLATRSRRRYGESLASWVELAPVPGSYSRARPLARPACLAGGTGLYPNPRISRRWPAMCCGVGLLSATKPKLKGANRGSVRQEMLSIVAVP